MDAWAHAWAIAHPVYSGMIGIAIGGVLVWLLFRWLNKP